MASTYEKLFRHVLYPAYESGLRRRKTLPWLREYEASQWLSREQIDALQWRKLKALLDYCYANVPYYRRQWMQEGIHPDDIRTRADFCKLPRLTKHDIRHNFEQLQAPQYRKQMMYKATGGSTGDPLRFGYTRESNERRNAIMWRGYGWAGATMGRRSVYLWSGAVGSPERAQLLKERIYHGLFNRHIVNSFRMSEQNMAEYADALDRLQPAIIVAYVSPLARLARWLLDTGRKPWRPQAILSAAEPLHDFQRNDIEKAFSAPMFNTYGCREFMLMASECERRDGLHVNADHLVLETVTDEHRMPGSEAGEVIITDLHNYGMPFIRYVNGDLATPVHKDCRCGRGLPLLSRIDGRRLDALRSPDGHVLPGVFFPHMLKDVVGISRFQVVQKQIDRLEIRIVRAQGFDESALDYIRAETAKVVGDSLELHFEFVEDIEVEANGKFRVTRCELP